MPVPLDLPGFFLHCSTASNLASSIDLTLIIGFGFLGCFGAGFVSLLFLLSMAMTDGEMCISDILVSSALIRYVKQRVLRAFLWIFNIVFQFWGNFDP